MPDPDRLAFRGAEPRSREDFQQVLLGLVEPFADPDALARQLAAVGQPAAHYPPSAARVELTSRLLWGLAPLAAGGGAESFRGWHGLLREIRQGTDPDHPGFWGPATAHDQRIVESAALGLALAQAPDRLWEPLGATERRRLADWLRTAAAAEPVDNNWRLFATLVDIGLRAVGERRQDPSATDAAFARIDAFHAGGGWFTDGPHGCVDYYNPWAFHFYGLVNAAHGALPARTEAVVRERARAFAAEFVYWFAADGAGVPFGRSLAYRFAQASFFGALAYAGEAVDGLGWGRVRGLWARNLRWWGRRPILNGDGTLSTGYGYPSLLMAEQYNAPGSAYWAFKAFLPLALPPDHPFWAADEEPELPREALEPVHAQPRAGLLWQRDAHGHTTALAAAPGGLWSRHGEAKYSKFAYSTAFAFSVPSRALELEGASGDSMLLLSEDGGRHWRAREGVADAEVTDRGVTASWSPWPDVRIETELLPLGTDGRWHLRRHRITTGRPLWTAEGGFCVPLSGAPADAEHGARAGAAFAAGTNPPLFSGIVDPGGPRDGAARREGAVVRPDPNTHLLWPRTLLPTLRGTLDPGTHLLVTAVYTDTSGDASGFADPPVPPER
jgi:hypothetical protein